MSWKCNGLDGPKHRMVGSPTWNYPNDKVWATDYPPGVIGGCSAAQNGPAWPRNRILTVLKAFSVSSNITRRYGCGPNRPFGRGRATVRTEIFWATFCLGLADGCHQDRLRTGEYFHVKIPTKGGQLEKANPMEAAQPSYSRTC